MPYSFKVNADGNVETSQNGQRVATGTAQDAATRFGYVVPAAAAPVPAAAPAVQQTTTAVRQQAQQNATTLQQKVASVTPPPATTDVNAANNSQDAAAATAKANGITQPGTSSLQGTVTNDTDNGDGTHTVSYADGTQDRVKVATNGDGSLAYTVLSPEAGVQYDAKQAVTAAQAKAQTQVDYATSTLDGIKQTSDAATSALIDSIKQTYAARISLMNDSNSRVLAAKDQEGLRSGRARYASGLQEGILSDEEQLGVARVAQLQGEMVSAIAQAQQAQTAEALTLFNARMDDLSKIDTNLQNAVQGIQTAAYNQLKSMQDANTAAINNAKTQQQMALDKAKVVAPALADQLAGLADDTARAAFLQEYSTQSGLSLDVLMGAVDSAQQDNSKAKLDLENIQSQIEDRKTSNAIAKQNADTASRNAANAKNKQAADDGSNEVDNIINGISSLSDVDASKKETVKAQLQAKGLYSPTPAAWYVQAQNDIAGADLLPAKIQTMWDAYRAKATAETD